MRYVIMYRVDQIITKVLHVLPEELKNRIMLHRMGELTATRSSLRCLEVGRITTDEYMRAVRETA